jgi:hypothetical protein
MSAEFETDRRRQHPLEGIAKAEAAGTPIKASRVRGGHRHGAP